MWRSFLPLGVLAGVLLGLNAAEPLTPPPGRAVCNLLGEGSDFEAGMKGFVAATDAGWLASEPAAKELFDSAEPHQGRFSLKLSSTNYAVAKDAAKRERNVLWFSPVKLDPAKTYTLSAWMKSTSGAEAKVEISCGEQGKGRWGLLGDGPASTVKVSGEWTRYFLNFKADKPKLQNFRSAQFYLKDCGPEVSVLIDEVQLEEGDRPSPYEAALLSLGVSRGQPYRLIAAQELPSAPLELLFRNNSKVPAKGKVSFKIKDYWDKVRLEGEKAFAVPANGNSSCEISLAGLPCGYYRASFDSEEGTLHDEAIFGVYSPVPSDGFLPVDWPLGCQSENGNVVDPLLRKLGFGWVRDWQFSFSKVCPEEGRFDFEKLDAHVERCLQAKLNLMLVLGPTLLPKAIPAWAAEHEGKSSLKKSWAKELRFPKMDAWKLYVKTLVARYKGRINTFELFNEPNCWLSADEYLPYLKATCEAAKEANPDALIVGGCATADLGQDPAPWTSRLIALDGAKYMDVLSVHMYGDAMPERCLKQGNDAFLQLLRDKLSSVGRNLPVWHTEKTYSTSVRGYSPAKSRIPDCYPQNNGYGFKVKDFRAKAEYLLRETLIDSAVGGGPFFWYMPILVDNMTQSVFLCEFGHVEYDGSPCPEILAANGLARMLLGREKPKGLLKLDASKYCALFEGPKGTLAALWDKDGDSALELPLSCKAFKVHDFFGMETSSTSSLRLTTAPSYITFEGMGAEEVKKIVSESKL